MIVIDKEENKNRDVTKLIMAGEGNWGKNINIPSMLINWEDGQALIKAIKKHDYDPSNPPVIAELVWDIP